MKFTSKSKFKTIFILFLALAVTLSVALWGIFRTRNSTTAVAGTGVGTITSAMNDADADWQTQREIYIWSTADPSDQGSDQIDNLVNSSTSAADIPTDSNTVNLLNGIVFKITSTHISAEKKEIRIKSGAQVSVNAVDPSVKRELEGNATYTQIIFDVPVVVEAEAVLTLNADVVFRAGVTVYGTLIINGMAFNQGTLSNNAYTTGTMTVANEVNSYAQIQSEGVIVNGSLNNDAARGGAIEIASGATLTVSASTQTEYTYTTTENNTTTTVEDSFSNHDGGALFLKGDGTDYNLTGAGKIENYGSIIYESGIALPSRMTINNNSIDLDEDNAPDAFGVSVGATFISSLDDISDSATSPYVFYPEANDADNEANDADNVYADGTSLSLQNSIIGGSSTRSWSRCSLLSFGRTTLTNSGAYSYALTNVNLGGGLIGANGELVYESSENSKTFTQGANELIFDGGAEFIQSASETRLLFLIGNDSKTDSAEGYSYTDGITTRSSLLTMSDTVSMFRGVNVVHNANSSTGGGVTVNGTLNVYGGKIAYNTVTNVSEQSAGGGVYAASGSTVNLYNGEITRNGLYSAGTPRCPSGAGMAVVGGTLNIYNGEITFNHGGSGAQEDGTNRYGADGGGVQGHSNATITMYGGSISNNYTGGYGGGVAMWESTFTMRGGTVSGNEAAWGGGVCANAASNWSTIYIYDGTIAENRAAEHTFPITTGRDTGSSVTAGGYGGGLCVGTDTQPYSSRAYIYGGTISNNHAVNGGGLAVYTQGDLGDDFGSDRWGRTTLPRSTITMSGGLITGNTAKKLGDGVYFESRNDSGSSVNVTGALLYLSGSASIDTSNNVSFKIPTSSTAAPIRVTDELNGTGLAAFVELDTPSSWTGKDIVSYSDSNDIDRDKFLLDDPNYAFYSTGSALQIRHAQNNNDYTATLTITTGGSSETTNHTTLEAAVTTAEQDSTEGATYTITINRSATLTSSMVITKNITILPASGADVTLGVASNFQVSASGATNASALFTVSGGGSLTIGDGTDNGSVTIDGNISSSQNMTLVYVSSGSFTLESNGTLQNINSTGNAGAVYLAEGTSATLSGTVYTTSGTYGAVYVSENANLTVNGATFSGSSQNASGQNYAVYAIGDHSTVKLSGRVNFGDNAIYTQNRITLGENFAPAEGASAIGVSFPPSRNAGTTIVDIPAGFGRDANTVNGWFKVVNMDEDYQLIVGAESSDGTSDLVVSKSVVYVFDFTYSNGYNSGSSNDADITFDSIGDVLNNYAGITDGQKEMVSTRGDLVMIEVQYGSNFPLEAIAGYAARTGYSLIQWQAGSSSTSYNYNGSLGYTDSESEISVRSVWKENSYHITFDPNAAGVADDTAGLTFGGTMSAQDISYTVSGTNLKASAYTLVGWKFTGWNTLSNGTGTSFGDEAVFNGSNLSFGSPQYTTDESGNITGVSYSITLYAQWSSIFSGGGIGTQNNPFVIENVNDLYILEATVNRTGKTDTSADTSSIYSVLNGYFNESTQTEDGGWTATYTAEDYAGYYFKLAKGFDNSDSGSAFTGVIGRVSTAAVTDGTPASEGKAHLNQEDQISQAVYGSDAAAGGTGAAAGTPFKGTFDGNGETITLNINKQKVEGNGADGATVSAGETVDVANGYGSYTQGDETLVGVGLFGYTDHATITNLTLAGSVHGYSHVGGLVGYAFGGTISNVTNTANITSGGHDVGGVIGTFFETAANYSASSVTNVLNQGNVTYAPRENGNKTTVLDVEDDWNELSIIADAEGIRFGGIVGAGVTLRLTGGYNRGDVTARYGVGGVVGTLRSLDDNRLDDAQITDSFNTGSVTATAGLYAVSEIGAYSQEFITAYTGGIVGRLVGVTSVRASFNSGSVSATFVAQILSSGTAGATTGTDGDLTIIYKHAIAPEIGSVDSNTYLGARGVGGIVGFTSVNANAVHGRMEISNVYNTGNISAWAGVGGIAGYLAYVDITNSFNGGNVTATGSHSEGSSRVAGGYAMSYGEETVYAAFLGAVVGRGIGAQLNSTVSFNANSTYTGGTDAVTSAIGDSSYNSIFGFTGNDDAASGLTSTQMRVSTAGSLPEGFAQSFNTSSWAFFVYTGEMVEGGTEVVYSYYPQLAAFASSEGMKTLTIGGTKIDVGAISKDSAQITYRNDAGGDDPITDDQEFTLTFNLSYQDAVFTLDAADPADGSGTSGGKKTYTKNADGSYSYTFTYPTDTYPTDDADEGENPVTWLEEPRDPTRVGYEFTGWYVDSGCTQKFNFNSIPGSNTIVYAGWTPVEYNITYLNVDDVGGSIGGEYRTSFTVEDIGTPSGSINLTTDVTRRGYEFTGWQYGSEGSRQTVTRLEVLRDNGTPTLYLYNNENVVVASIVLDNLNNNTLYLYATWENATYTITYYLDDAAYNHGSGTAIGDVPDDFASYTFGTQLFTLWSGASNPGYTFDGWKIVSYDSTDETNKEFYENRGVIYALEAGTVGDIVLVGDWTPIQYTITFNLGSGSLSSELYSKFSVAYKMTSNLGLYSITIGYGIKLGSLKNEAGEAKPAWDTFVPTAPEGYEFAGWYTGLSGAVEQITLADYAIRSDENVTLYAHYTQESYEVTVSIPGSSSGVTDATTVTYESSSYVPTGNITDGWEYTISGVAHGSGVEGVLSAIAGALTIDSNYQFTGWSIAFKEDTATGSASIYRVTGDLTVTATTTRASVVVNFVGQDGNTLDTVTLDAGNTLPPEKIPSDPDVFGYTFNGWSYNGEVYTAEKLAALTFNTSATVYAKYTAAKVTVNWQINGTSKRIDSYFTYGSQIGTLPTLAELGFTGDNYLGYEIVNWYAQYSDNTFSDQVFAGTVFTEDQITPPGDNVTYSITLYGKIDLHDYTITFTSNSGGSVTNWSGSTYRYNEGSSTSTSVNVTVTLIEGFATSPNTGYELTGWSVTYNGVTDDNMLTVDEDFDLAFELAGYLLTNKIAADITVTAQWGLVEYSVWFDAGSGSFDVDAASERKDVTFYNSTEEGATAVTSGTARYAVITVEYGASAALGSLAPTLTGSSFAGWNFGSTAVITADRTAKDGNAIVAYWTTERYTITYMLDGGTLDNSAPNTYQYAEEGSGVITFIDPEKEGYEFKGWYTESTYTNTITSTAGETGNLVLYAKWSVKTYYAELTITGLPNGTSDTKITNWFKGESDNEEATNNNLKGLFEKLTGFFVQVVTETDGTVTATVTFSADYGTDLTALNGVLQPQTVKVGETETYYIPGNWMDGGTVYYFTTMPARGESDVSPFELTCEYTSTTDENRTFTVTFYANYSDSDQTVLSTTTGLLTDDGGTGKGTVSFFAPSREGYTFLGWSRSADGDVIENFDSAGDTYTVTGDTPLYAIWEINSYSVSYQTNSGSWASDAGATTLEYGAVINAGENEVSEIPEITRTGYTFGGWYTDPNFSEGRIHTMPAYSVTLYAQWIPNDYQVNFHYDDTSATSDSLDSYAGSTSAVSFAYGDAIAFNTANVDHYTFVWYMYANGSVKPFSYTAMPDLSSAESDFSSFVTREPGENDTIVYTINLYAVYTAVEYFIDYQGGYNSTKVTAADTAESKLTSANASTGYECLGWTIGGGETTYSYYAVDENAGVKGVYFRTGEGVTDNQHFVAFTELENTVLVPSFQPIEYTFTLDADGGTLGSESDTIKVTFGEYYGTLPTPTKNGYTFLGWYTAQENGILIGSTTTLTTGTLPSDAEDDSTGTLYARWRESTYTITYVLNGGSWVEGNPTVTTYTYGTGATLPDGSALTAPTGYTFAGWYDAETGGNPVTAIDTGEYGNKTFYARWTPNSYTIAFEEADGNNVDNITNATYGSTVALPVPTRDGYDFLGWYLSDDSESLYTGNVAVSALAEAAGVVNSNHGTIMLMAKWSAPHTYTVTLDGTNVSAAADSTFTATHGTEYTLTLTPNTGYSLPDSVTVTMGGSTTEAYSYNSETGEITITSVTGNIFITAEGQVISYNVTVSGSNLDGNTSDPAQLTHNVQYTITINAATGYRITEYSVTMGSSGTVTPVASYSNDNGTLTLTFAAYTVTGDIVITVNTIAQYTVSFDLNGNGDGVSGSAPSDMTVDADTEIILPSGEGIVRNGYTFIGWNTDKEATAGLTLYTVTETVTLYAIWQANTYTVTLMLTFPSAATAQIVNERMQALGTLDLAGMSTSLSSTQEDDKTIYTITVTVTAAYGTSLEELCNKISTEEFAQFRDEHNVIYTLSVPGFTDNTTIPVGGASFSGTWVSESVKTLTVTVDGENSTYYVTQTDGKFTFDLSTLGTPEKAGYVFAGWSIDREDGTISGDGKMLTITAGDNAVTVTATWTAIQYTITFNNGVADGSVTGTMQAQTFDYESGTIETATLTAKAFIRTGYQFMGWATSSGGDVVYTDKALLSSVLPDTKDETVPVNLYAVWKAIEYTIVFNPDEGLGAVNAVTASLGINGGEVELPSGGFTRVGYDFAGWAYEDGEVITGNTLTIDAKWITSHASDIGEDNTIILYAVWKVKTYTVTFNTKGGTLSGGISVSAPYEGTDGASSITLETPTREGYTFLGWATSNDENAPVVYAGGASISVSQLFTGLEEEGSRTLKLYAKWEAETYTVTFNGTNVAAGEGNQYTVTYQQENGYTFTLSAVTGYNLRDSVTVAIGGGEGTSYYVSKNENGTGTIKIDAANVTGNIVITAEGDAIKYTVTVSAGDGTFEEIPEGASGTGSEGAYTSFTIKLAYGTNVLSMLSEVGVNVPTAYHHHSGWLVAEDGDVNDLAFLTHAITITAQYAATDGAITVTIVHADGTVQMVQATYGGTLSQTDAFTAPEGYQYNGWYYGENTPFEFGSTQITAPITLYPNATAKTYSVALAGEDSHLTIDKSSATHGQSYTVTLKPEEGYSLPESVKVTMGGTTLTEGEGYTYDSATGVLTISFVTGEITINAAGVINTYTVTFNPNNGEDSTTQKVDYLGKASKPTKPTPDGYTFVGWYLNGAEYDFDTAVTGDITLVAQWTLNTYKVTLNPNYDGAASTTYTYAHGSTVTEPTDPTRTGYTFKFWYVQGGAETDYFSGGEKTATGDITLVAKWEINAYTVTFNPNNGEGSTTQKVDYLGKASKPADPVRDGYTFLGWYLDGAPYDFNGDVTGDITLVAQWSENYYTVTFTDGDATVASVSVKEGDMVSAPALTAEAGKTFVGWYAEGPETAFDFSTPITADIELTAKWELAKYSVSYVLGGGTNAENNPTSYTIESGAITLTAPTREGYTFAGWYDAEENGNLVTEIAAGSTGNITLYARWTANEFTVTFEANGGTLAEGEGSQSVVYGATATAPAAPTREGYVFVGWYAEGSETAFDFSTPITADIELTAKWELAKYSVSYVLGGGTNAENNPTSYTIESGAIALTAPTREGYTFAGWYDAEESGNLVTEIAAGSTGNITLYARWTANEFTVTFEANGGTLAEGEAVQTVTVGGTVAYVEPVRENYLFVGWFTDEALTERYDFNKVVTGGMTLYAKWRLQVVTGTTTDGTVVTVSSDTGFDDGTSLRFVEVTDEETINTAAGSLAENMSLARLFDIELIDANGNPIAITQPLSVGISVEGLAEAEGSWGVVYVSDDGSTTETLATHIGTDGRLYFFVEHFSFYAVVDITEIAAGFAWWWILVAVAGCMILALIIVIITRSMRRYELNYVNGGIPSQKLKESALIDLPIPEREEEAFDGWYYDETFRDRATLTSMPKQNLILFAKWRKMTDAERAARDQKRAEEAAQAAEGFHHAEPKKPKNEQHEQPPREIKEDE